MTTNLSRPIPAGPRGHGKQCRLAVPAGDREDQEPLLPQPDAGHEHREEAGPEQQDRGAYSHNMANTNRIPPRGL